MLEHLRDIIEAFKHVRFIFLGLLVITSFFFASIFTPWFSQEFQTTNNPFGQECLITTNWLLWSPPRTHCSPLLPQNSLFKENNESQLACICVEVVSNTKTFFIASVLSVCTFVAMVVAIASAIRTSHECAYSSVRNIAMFWNFFAFLLSLFVFLYFPLATPSSFDSNQSQFFPCYPCDAFYGEDVSATIGSHEGTMIWGPGPGWFIWLIWGPGPGWFLWGIFTFFVFVVNALHIRFLLQSDESDSGFILEQRETTYLCIGEENET